MPAIYTPNIPHVIQNTNKSDAKSQAQVNNTFQATKQSINTASLSYTSTIIPPKGLSSTAIVFIVSGVITAVIVLGIFIWCVYRRKKHKKRIKPTTPNPVFTVAKPPSPPVDPKPHSVHRHAPPRNPRPTIPLLLCVKPFCQEYLNQLNINKAYFNSRHDKCFCMKCHDSSNSDAKCGHWCQQQHGWVRFGLSINQAHQKEWSIFKEWKTSYYGTSSNRLASILINRFVPFDGDKLSNGTIFNSGHPDPKYCITSPSLICASQPKFTTRSQFRASDGTNYNVRLVLQCKQKPDAYSINGDTKSFHSIEWATETRCALVPYGLFVRLQRQKI